MFCPTHNRYSCDFQMKVMVRPVTVKKVMESMLMSLPTAFGSFQQKKFNYSLSLFCVRI